MASTEPTDTKPSTVNKPSKKKYSAPIFTEYGTIRDITKAVGQSGQLDGGGIANRIKTNV
jgi:hypothetical protein